MAEPELVPSVTFDEASSEADRAINFGILSRWKCNEYSIAVIDSGGQSVTGTVAGLVSVFIYSPGSDRPTSLPAVDLSTGVRKFSEFSATVNRAVFSVTGLSSGQQIRITAARSPAPRITGTTPDPVNLRQWTPDYSDAGYVLIPRWSASADFVISMDFIYSGASGAPFLLGGSEGQGNPVGGDFSLQVGVNRISFGILNTVIATADLSRASARSLEIRRTGNQVTLTADGQTGIGSLSGSLSGPVNIGGRSNGFQLWNGQIYNLRLTDLTTPSNSRFYPGLITSTTRPTTTTLVDELSGENGTLTNFPTSMEWTEVETGAPVVQMDLRNDLSVFPASAGSATFARNSIATGVRNGRLSQVAVNVPRFEDEGVLIEGVSENLSPRSSEASDTESEVTILTDIEISPLGGMTADRVVPSEANTFHTARKIITISGDTEYLISVYVKPSGYNFLFINTQRGNTAGNVGVVINLQTGEVSGSSVHRNLNITPVPDGWLEVSFEFTSVSGEDTLHIDFNVLPTEQVAAYQGDSVSGILVWGVSLYNLDLNPSYLPTTGAALTRPADALTVPFPISGTQDFTIFIVARINGFENDFPRLFDGVSFYLYPWEWINRFPKHWAKPIHTGGRYQSVSS